MLPHPHTRKDLMDKVCGSKARDKHRAGVPFFSLAVSNMSTMLLDSTLLLYAPGQCLVWQHRFG